MSRLRRILLRQLPNLNSEIEVPGAAGVEDLVGAGLLRKRDEDSLSDFVDKFDFQDAFALKVFEGQG